MTDNIGGISILTLFEGLLNNLIKKKILSQDEARKIVEEAKQQAGGRK